MEMIQYKMIGENIAYTKLPKEIVKELTGWKKECDKIKKHPLSYLKLHENFGSKTNNYQVSIPSKLIEDSYWLPFVLRLCSILTKEPHRNFFIRKWNGHFDGYDVWINYSYKNNSNPEHAHAGCFSGVIYLNNKKDKTIFTKEKVNFVGKKGDMIIFPSTVLHKVNKQKEKYERITFAFNINRQLWK
jgi:hypothetical protein|tara:strand:+ start:3710 stop:4270 length:561 start_codon:yes stop_codon:yes gene_type:complete